MLLATFRSLFLFPETAWPFCPGFLLPAAHWLEGVPAFLLPRISSFLALCFLPPIWAPKLNSVTQSTLQILHQKDGTTFGLGHCRICDGRCGTFTFFFEGYQFWGCFCPVTQLKLDCCGGTLGSEAIFLLIASGTDPVLTSWKLKIFISYEKWNLAWRILPKKIIGQNIMLPDNTDFEHLIVNIATTDKYVICFP